MGNKIRLGHIDKISMDNGLINGCQSGKVGFSPVGSWGGGGGGAHIQLFGLFWVVTAIQHTVEPMRKFDLCPMDFT